MLCQLSWEIEKLDSRWGMAAARRAKAKFDVSRRWSRLRGTVRGLFNQTQRLKAEGDVLHQQGVSLRQI